MNFNTLKDWGVGGTITGGLAVAGKAIWQLMNRRQVVRQADATATKTEIESLDLPFKQATEMMKMLREDLDSLRKRYAEDLETMRLRCVVAEHNLELCRAFLIKNGLLPPDSEAR